MAAVICKGLSNLCDALGEVLCLPCRACGYTCDKLGDVFTSSFFPYIALTAALNLPPLVLGAEGSSLAYCESLTRWFGVNAALSAVHIVASLYVVYKIQRSRPAIPASAFVDTSSKVETGTYQSASVPLHGSSSETAQNSFARIRHVLCYDVGVAIYILLCAVWLVWQSMGFSALVGFDADECGDVGKKLMGSVVCGFLYMSMGGIGFACSLCCLR